VRPTSFATLIAAALATAVATAALAQQFPQPSTDPNAAFPDPFARQPPAECQQFLAINQEMQKRGEALSVAFKKRPSPQEACSLLKSYGDVESRMAKFVQTKGTLCGIPPQVLDQIKKSQARTTTARNNACQAAARPQGPAAPTLSEALGSIRVPDASTTRTGRGGAFDTMTGSAIAR